MPTKEFERLHGPLLLFQITKKHVREFRDHLANGELKESTGAKHFRCIKTLFKFAVSEGYIDHSPAEGIEWQWSKVKSSESDTDSRQTLTVPEVKTLLAKAGELPKYLEKQDIAWF